MDRIRKAIQKLGIPVAIGTKSGLAVIYPEKSGNITHTSEGHSYSGRFMFFSEISLLENAEYGDIVSDGKNQYMILWTDTYSCRYGSYAKACMKIFTDGSVVSS